MDCIVHGVAKSWTQVSNFHFHFPKTELRLSFFFGSKKNKLPVYLLIFVSGFFFSLLLLIDKFF